jgi:hypothetical protein
MNNLESIPNELKNNSLTLSFGTFPNLLFSWINKTETTNQMFVIEKNVFAKVYWNETIKYYFWIFVYMYFQFCWPEILPSDGKHRAKILYRFDILPAGLFNRAQVRLYQISDSSSMWKRGSLLKKNDHVGLMIMQGWVMLPVYNQVLLIGGTTSQC